MTSTHRQVLDDASLISPDPAVREAIVEQIMQRIGVNMPPRRFVHEVGLAYASVAPTRGAPLAELSHSDALFRAAIRKGMAGPSVLAIGCGDGLCGFDPIFAHNECLAVWPPTPAVDNCALTAPLLWDRAAWPSKQYDVVVSYLIAHYLYDLTLFFRLVTAAVRPGGTFVLAGHNASFWRVPELRQHAADVSGNLRTPRGWKGYLPTRARVARLTRLLVGQREPDLMTRIEGILATRLGATGRISREELAHMIDIHRPPAQPADPLQIGRSGFGVDELTAVYLPEFSLEFCGTRGWAGFVAEERLTDAQRARTRALEQQYPSDGVFFSACWRKR